MAATAAAAAAVTGSCGELPLLFWRGEVDDGGAVNKHHQVLFRTAL